MTTKERKALQKIINRMDELEIEKSTAFYELQVLNEDFGDGTKWCSVQANVEGVLKHGDEYSNRRALAAYRRYFEADAKEALIRDLGGELANLGFWSKK